MTITATQTIALINDLDGDGLIDPGGSVDGGGTVLNTTGDTIRATVTIANTAGGDATGVFFSEATDNLTVGNVNVSPLAFDDAYSAVGNATLPVSAADGVLGASTATPDREFLGVTFGTGAGQTRVMAETIPTAGGGSVTLNADGSFSYTPAADSPVPTLSPTPSKTPASTAASPPTGTISPAPRR